MSTHGIFGTGDKYFNTMMSRTSIKNGNKFINNKSEQRIKSNLYLLHFFFFFFTILRAVAEAQLLAPAATLTKSHCTPVEDCLWEASTALDKLTHCSRWPTGIASPVSHWSDPKLSELAKPCSGERRALSSQRVEAGPSWSPRHLVFPGQEDRGCLGPGTELAFNILLQIWPYNTVAHDSLVMLLHFTDIWISFS